MSLRIDLAELQLLISAKLQVYQQIETITTMYGIYDCEIPRPVPTTDEAIANQNEIYLAEKEWSDKHGS